jgi:hypothetical protein
MTSKIIELDRERILKRIGYCKKGWRAFIVDGFGYVGAIEIITPGHGAFGQGGRAVVIIRNFIRYIEGGGNGYYVPPEYFIAKIRTEINDERLPQKILKRLEAMK